ANPRYLKLAQSEILCLYSFPYNQSTHANRLIPDGEETLALERESRSKLNKDSVRPYDYTTLNSLYENFKPPTPEYEIQLAHANEIKKKMWQKSFVKYKPNIFKNIRFLPVSKLISKSRQAYNVMTNNINHFKEIVDNAWIKHSKDQFHTPTAHDMEIMIQTRLIPLALKTQNDSFIFVHELKQEMHVDLKYVESLEKEIDELEYDKAEFSNMYDMILQECVSNEVMCTYLFSLSDLDALSELQCLYLHKVKECDCLAQKHSKQTESVSKEVHTELLQRFAKVEKHSISIEIALQKCKEHECRIDNRTTETRTPQSPQTVRNTNRRVSTSTGVNHKTNVSRPQQRSNQLIDKVVPNNSQVKLKKTQVEEHPRISSISNKIKSVTACNDSLNSRTLNVNVFAPIIGYGDLVHGNITINRVYYVEGLNHNLFSVGQFCDADLEVAFSKSTCFVRDLQGNDLLTGNRGSDLCTISLQDSTSSTLLCLMAKATPTQAWLWHRRLSHLNFDYINLLLKKDIMIGLPKLKNIQAPVITVRTDKGTEFLNKTLNAFFKEGIEHQTATARTPEQNGVVERWNRTLMKEKGDQCILVGYSTPSMGYRVYNKRTRMIVESIHIRFDEIKEVNETFVANNTSGLVPQRQKASNYDNPDPVP
nr:integrase, catalytic region, zinc finger, CCHC-type, peptidase aspartic, catalytic [Tanacetum cinerariifolium]